MLPESLCTLYQCFDQPLHLSVEVEKMFYTLPYREYAGGIMSLSKSTLTRFNGMSNLYFGWGGEDDNLFGRLVANKLQVKRYSETRLRRFWTLQHKRSPSTNTGRTKKRVCLQMKVSFQRFVCKIKL